MRIVGGQYGGRVLNPSKSKKWPTRPTTDMAKEALFNILVNRLDFESISMLDLFGGLGNHSLEALSRGCNDITYVERHIGCIGFVKKTISQLASQDKIKIHKQDVFKFLNASLSFRYDYIFADPPYAMKDMDRLVNAIFKNDKLTRDGLFVLEHDQSVDFSSHPCFKDMRKYGISRFSFFNQAK